MNFVNAFQKIGLTTAAIIAAVAFLFNSIAPAKATYPQTINGTGKIMMEVNSFVHNGNFFFHVLAWDSESGENTMYSFNPKAGSFYKSDYQLPDSPID